MKKGSNVLKGILFGVLAFCVVVAIAFGFLKYNKSKNAEDRQEVTKEEKTKEKDTKKESDKKEEKEEKIDALDKLFADISSRKLFTINFDSSGLDYVPSVPAYQTAEGGSNVVNMSRFYLQDQMMEALVKNNFVVVDSEYTEFFDLYEMNRYLEMPSFITTDSMMHTYHLYFAMLQKNTEKQYLCDTINELSIHMYENSLAIRNELVSTEWEEAASTNVAFFAIGAMLMGNNIDVPDYVSEIVLPEYEYIEAADGIHVSMLINEEEDYSQYKPRGYYEGDVQLEKYFKAMMWYGRRNFKQSEELETRAALLMNLAMDEEAIAAWEKVYTITAFFAGASDDCGYYEYMPLIKQAYGDSFAIKDLAGNTDGWDKFNKLISTLEPPKINSVVFEDNDNEDKDRLAESKGFRFMGQRFTLDASIFTNLCYSKVKENSNGDKRMLPVALDVAAAMGSEEALSILEDKGETDYKNYKENMAKLQKDISEAPDEFWSASLYGGWLNTLSPLLEKKGEGYPSFMTNKAWERKSIETYLGSWTELKHDTVLYSKQFMAEMGGGDIEEDTRGYVEPEPELFDRLYSLTNDTMNGLDEFGIISASDKENMKILGDISLRLRDISIKELNNEKLTDDDYEFIKEYGGNIEHLWRKTITDVPEDQWVDSAEYPCALVTDVATDPNGSVLEEAIGGVSEIYVVFPIDGELHIAKGGVFTYYEFQVPISERMTDSTWRRKLGLEIGEDMDFPQSEDVPNPDWTELYRKQYVYNFDY